MIKPDFSKQAIKRFFLYHSEKLILALSFALLGLFFWLGYGSQVFQEKTPKELSDLASRADQYIVNGTNWEMISELEPRKADDRLVERIEDGDQRIDASKFPYGVLSVKAQTLEPRSDPRLFEPKDLIAHVITTPVLLSPAQVGKKVSDPMMIDLPLAKPPIDEDSMSMGMGMGMGGDLGGFDGGFGGRGGSGRSGRAGSNKTDDKKKDEPKIDAGYAVLSIHEKTMPGLRPPSSNISNAKDMSFVMSLVAITGVVDIKQQSKDFETSFASGVGYFPSRDKPIHSYVQVERTEVVGGKETGWKDISESISTILPKWYPSGMVKMPQSIIGTAPEYVAAENYDPVLTGPIPPLSQFDYRSFVIHPKVAARVFDPLTLDDTREEIETPDQIFDTVATTGGNQNLFGPGQMIQSTSDRAGSNVSKYAQEMQAKKTTANYKLLRFFDLEARAGTTYRYRVRVWLKDANHEPTELELAVDKQRAMLTGQGNSMPGMGGMDMGGGRGMGGMGDMGGMGMGGRGMGGMGGMDMGGMGMGGMDMGGMGGLGGQMGPGGTTEPVYEYIPISAQMKHPKVRTRLKLAREVVDPTDKNKITYFVTEYRKSADGADEVSEEVQVPAGHPELRFARPTSWSQLVEISVTADLSEVIAGQIEQPRSLRIGSQELPDGEPVTEVVPTVWNKKYNALLPARKQARRGDALDFSADVHVVNSITWGVHVYRNAPILTETVLVDMMGGKELDLPRSELMRHRLPSEMLIMNADGTFDIANDLDDRTKYKQALLEADDTMEVGGEKAAKQRQRDQESGRGMGGFDEGFGS